MSPAPPATSEEDFIFRFLMLLVRRGEEEDGDDDDDDEDRRFPRRFCCLSLSSRCSGDGAVDDLIPAPAGPGAADAKSNASAASTSSCRRKLLLPSGGGEVPVADVFKFGDVLELMVPPDAGNLTSGNLPKVLIRIMVANF